MSTLRGLLLGTRSSLSSSRSLSSPFATLLRKKYVGGADTDGDDLSIGSSNNVVELQEQQWSRRSIRGNTRYTAQAPLEEQKGLERTDMRLASHLPVHPARSGRVASRRSTRTWAAVADAGREANAAGNPLQTVAEAAVALSHSSSPLFHRDVGRRNSQTSDSLASISQDDGLLGGKRYDPALVVDLDSKSREIHLNPIQRNLLWEARKREYQGCLHRIVLALESHLTPFEKCHSLLALHDEVIRRRLRLRDDTYEEVFHVFYAVSVMGTSAPVMDHGSGKTPSRSGSLALPPELSGASAASSIVSPTFLQNLWTMYRYMIDSGTRPNPRIIQHMMGILERVDGKCIEVEAKAHSLIMDCDRFKLTPTEYTLASYIGVCSENGVMHLALARYTDMKSRHERQLSSGVCALLLVGLVRNKHYDEAMSVVATLGNTPVSNHLLNAILQAARHSRDPMSAFTFYRSICQSRGSGDGNRDSRSCNARVGSGVIVPTVHTFGILVEVLRITGDDAEAGFVLNEMRRYRVKGTDKLLNRLLGVLLHGGEHRQRSQKLFLALRSSMRKRGVRVFDEFERTELLSC